MDTAFRKDEGHDFHFLCGPFMPRDPLPVLTLADKKGLATTTPRVVLKNRRHVVVIPFAEILYNSGVNAERVKNFALVCDVVVCYGILVMGSLPNTIRRDKFKNIRGAAAYKVTHPCGRRRNIVFTRHAGRRRGKTRCYVDL